MNDQSRSPGRGAKTGVYLIYAAVLLLAAAVVFIVIDRKMNTLDPDDAPTDVRSPDLTEDPGLSSDVSSSGRSNDPDNASGFGDSTETVGQSDPSVEPNTSGLPDTTEIPVSSVQSAAHPSPLPQLQKAGPAHAAL